MGAAMLKFPDASVVAVAIAGPPSVATAVTVTPAMGLPTTLSVTVPEIVPVVGAEAPAAPSDPLPHPKKRSGTTRNSADKENIDFLMRTLHEMALRRFTASCPDIPCADPFCLLAIPPFFRVREPPYLHPTR
jgi:hypothetical protein